MNYPRRFYRRTKTGKSLNVTENNIGVCRWCGTHFIRRKYDDFCTDNCFMWSKEAGEMLGFNRTTTGK